MALEILFFRSLFRNTKIDLKDGPRIVYGANKYLWLAGLAFHWSFLIIFLRHFKFFAEPVPFWVSWLQDLDGFFQIGLPIIYVTDVLLIAAVTYLFLRRVVDPKMRYISLAADYFPLFLILGIGLSGVWMRYFAKADIVSVKELATGLVAFSFGNPPDGIGSVFYIHIFLVSVLFAYFPFSKLMHMGGVFMSPTRNLANNNRMKRHVNPWDYPVKVHTYEEWEDEFRDVMKAADMPLEKE
jgi:nitrate reductase gamma subunit